MLMGDLGLLQKIKFVNLSKFVNLCKILLGSLQLDLGIFSGISDVYFLYRTTNREPRTVNY